MKKRECSVLATDLSKLDKNMELWQEKREKKGNIYQAFSEYILCLENCLEYEENSYKRCLIEEEIKKLKKEREKYNVPSVLSMAKYDLFTRDRDGSEATLEKAGPKLIKHFRSIKVRRSWNSNEESSIN